MLSTKQLGAFYTPEKVAASLAAWAIRTGHESILEPSAGGGALLSAALNRAKAISGQENGFSILACDIDPQAVRSLQKLFRKNANLYLGDFLDLNPKLYNNFDVVIANPPFTRNHAIEVTRRHELKRRFGVAGAAGLWVHFLLHAKDFLAPGGRIASIVPGAALFTKYGEEFIRRICMDFKLVSIYELDEKPAWIGDAEERGAIILADGYKQGSTGSCRRGVWSSYGEVLEAPLQSLSQAYTELINQSQPLGEIADLSIGAVTGRNKIFLLTEDERRSAGITLNEVRPIVSRARQIEGVAISKEDLLRLGKAGQKTWLLTPRSLRGPAAKRLSLISEEERRSITWLNKRDPWWHVDPGPDCDAVFTYMNHEGPRLALVGKGIVCTNTLHRVVFKPKTHRSLKIAAALTFASSFGQLAAELTGRIYGGGVLKFELLEARRFPILPINLDAAEAIFRRLDIALRQGAREAARQIADEALLSPILGRGWRKASDEMLYDLQRRREARGLRRAVLSGR